MAPPDESNADPEQARARSLALLEAVHRFPGEYAVTVVALNQESVTEAVRQAAVLPGAPPAEGGGGAEGEATAGPARAASGDVFVAYETRASREGKYLSHRLTVRVQTAHEVLDLYARLRALDGVLTLL